MYNLYAIIRLYMCVTVHIYIHIFIIQFQYRYEILNHSLYVCLSLFFYHYMSLSHAFELDLQKALHNEAKIIINIRTVWLSPLLDSGFIDSEDKCLCTHPKYVNILLGISITSF